MKIVSIIVLIGLLGIGLAQNIRIESDFPKEAAEALMNGANKKLTEEVASSRFKITGDYEGKKKKIWEDI